MVIASQEDQQRQWQGYVGSLCDVLLWQLPLQTTRAPLPLGKFSYSLLSTNIHDHDPISIQTGYSLTPKDPS